MPHLIETYALYCGAKIDKPYIFDKYYPLPFEKYITLHTTTKDSKTYDYWNDVVDILFPILEAAGIKIVQIGGKDDKPARNAHHLHGRTSLTQTAYLIKHSLLHLGVDSFPVHLASTYEDTKIVALYSNNYKEVVGPYWGKKENQILLEPKRAGKPSFALSEFPKTINNIRPEEIARAVCKLLNLNYNWKFETIWVGQYYHNGMIEAVPNQVVDISSLNLDALIVRMDFEFCEGALFEQLKLCKCSIVTNKAIDLRILSQCKENIIEIVYVIENDNQPQFIRELQRLGIKFHLVTYLPDEDMNRYKLHFMEFGLLHHRKLSRPDLIKEAGKQFYFKSSKFILSNQRTYPSRIAMIMGRDIPKMGPTIGKIDHPPELEQEFLKELECFSILVDSK
jgi:hypothetical protein